MKLEPNKLMPYLPYSLKVIMEGKKCNVGWMSTKNIAIIRQEGIGEVKKIKWEYAHLNIKPILRPLSDLVKELDINKEKITPMERLLDIETKHNWSCLDYLECESGQNEWWVKMKGKRPSYIFGYNSIMGFYLLNQFSEKEFVRNQIELFEKLYEWHFDVFGLINLGLAIDINTLK